MTRAPLMRALVALVLLGISVWITLSQSPRLGLDLRGGTQIVLEARDTPTIEVTEEVTDRVLEVLRGRVDALGVAEPSIARSGENRIIVELPGLQDPTEAADVLGRTAQLTIHPVLGAGENPDAELVLPDEQGLPLQLGPARIAGEDIEDARAEIPQNQFGWVVAIDFAGDAGAAWAQLTGEAACAPAGDPSRRTAIVLDERIISAPAPTSSIRCGVGIIGGTTVIEGTFTEEEARELALLISGGALPVPVEIIEQRTVGPSLGADAIAASAQAAIIGIALTGLFLLIAYRLVGLAAVIALAGYSLVAYAALTAIGATLTLPGLAGFVLAIGMAVDANVLVAERAREEYAQKPQLQRSSDKGFQAALPAILDSGVTTLLAAVLLFFLASGPVRGFGVTLTLGVIVSLFSALVLARAITELIVRSKSVQRRPRISGIASIGPVRRRLESANPDLLARRRRWLAASGVVVVLALSGIAARGLDLGVEFTGGRLIEYTTGSPVDADTARAAVADAGFPRAVVQASGEGDISVRIGELTNVEAGQVRDAVAGVSGGAQVLRDELIGPTLGDELRQGALIALGLALLAQLVYLAVRFRWTYSAGAVAALAANVAVVVGSFAWLGRPFDGVFLAALLTVIGYTVNDAVVVFDRIREAVASRPTGTGRPPFHRVVGRAVLSTLPRTVNTGLSTLIILFVLLLIGGDTLADFALALIIGILAGVTSTVAVATPLAIELESRFPAPPPRKKVAPENRGTGAVV